MSHHTALASLCDCFGCTRSVMCGFDGADRCDVCIFDMKTTKYPRRCLISVCTKLSAKDKKECIREYDRLLSDHMKVSTLSEGTTVFCSWHINGRRSWGKVQRRYQDKDCKSELYAVHFYDDRIQMNIKRMDIFDEWEYTVWIEKIRLLHDDLVYLSMQESSHVQRSQLTVEHPYDSTSLHVFEPLNKRLTRGSKFSLSELFQLRCQTCSSCTMADCGKCESCLVNQNSTSRERQICLLKICKKISEESKIRLSKVKGWSYFFNDLFSETKIPSSISRLPTVYHKLRLLHSSYKGNKSMNIFDAIQTCESKEEQRDLGVFFENTFGHCLHEPTDSLLIGECYHHRFFSADGSIRDFWGKISHCFKHIISGERQFTVQFSALQISGVDSISSGESVAILSEQMAWGGFKSYSLQKNNDLLFYEKTSGMSKAPYFIQWSIPSSRLVQIDAQHYYPYVILEYKGCKLQFEVKPSMIPGAGNGLFVSCIGGKKLYLEPGEMLDLGVYAPLHECNVKSKHISLVKNLLFDWQIEVWAFAVHKNRPGAFAYDPTDDFSGIPNFQTQMNGICFVNEINGNNETASISAQYDPDGNMHYLLGHWEEHEGPLIVPSGGKAQELLIDYGESYERCRLRNGYSRLGLTKSQHIKNAKLEEDKTAVLDISNFTASQVCDCLSFFETLYAKGWLKASMTNHQRALLIVLSLDSRVDSIVEEFNGFDMTCDEFCDGGFSILNVDDTKTRFKTVIAAICSHFPGKKLKEAILSMKLLRIAASERLCYEAKEATLDWRTISSELINSSMLTRN